MSGLTGRKAALFAVMGGALALTINGEVQAVSPMLGPVFGGVMAAVFALSTLLALNYVIEGRGSVRFWAWGVLALAGGMELGLNTWHALTTVNSHGVPALPTLAAVAIGAGPVVLAGLLSHLVSLTMTPHTTEPVATEPEPVAAEPVASAPEATPGTGVLAVAPVASVAPVPVRATATRTGAPSRPRKAVGSGTRTGVKPARPDEELRAVLSYPELVARDADGTVPVRRAARELGCGVDRARKLLREAGLLATDTAAEAVVEAA